MRADFNNYRRSKLAQVSERFYRRRRHRRRRRRQNLAAAVASRKQIAR